MPYIGLNSASNSINPLLEVGAIYALGIAMYGAAWFVSRKVFPTITENAKPNSLRAIELLMWITFLTCLIGLPFGLLLSRVRPSGSGHDLSNVTMVGSLIVGTSIATLVAVILAVRSSRHSDVSPEWDVAEARADRFIDVTAKQAVLMVAVVLASGFMLDLSVQDFSNRSQFPTNRGIETSTREREIMRSESNLHDLAAGREPSAPTQDAQ